MQDTAATPTQPTQSPSNPAILQQSGASAPAQPQKSVTRDRMSSRMRSSFGAGISPLSAQSSDDQIVPAPPVVADVQQSVSPPQDIIPAATVSDADRLAIFDAVLDQIENEKPVLPPAPPAAISQQTPVPQPVTQPVLQSVPSAVTQSVDPVPVVADPAVAPTQPPAVADIAQAQQPAGDQNQIFEPGVVAQAMPGTIDALTNTLNPQQHAVGTVTAKERATTTNPDQTIVDAGTGIQFVEQEPIPEIPVEVESFIQRVESNVQTAPHEIVIADGTQEQPKAKYPTRPVVVLPITQATEDEGAKKSPKFSIRWLIEWSHKVIKMFAGKVIYREEEKAE